MPKIILLSIAFLFNSQSMAACLDFSKENLEAIQVDKHKFYHDKEKTFMASQACVKSDVSQLEAQEALKKSGTIEAIGESRIFHVVEKSGARIVSILDFGAHTSQVSLISSKISLPELKKKILELVK